jgi:uncharacterized membrane protein
MSEASANRGSLDARLSRRQYLDWMRGLAVLIMIEAHLVDSWTRFPDRETREYGWSMILGGFGAPLFLFLAGVTVALSAGAKVRKSGDVGTAGRAVFQRGLEIFGLAFLFRVQAWILGWSSPRTLLKVDILNIMGPSIMAAAALWGALSTQRARLLAFVVATLSIALFTPIIRAWHWLAVVPDPIEAYIRPASGLSNFVFFPWAGLVLAGGVVGLLLDGARSAEDDRRFNVWFGIGGASLAVAAYVLSFLPSPYAQSYFWTTSPTFFFLRVGIMTAAIAVAYAWELRPGGRSKWSPLRQLGRTSLFIYWIHVEMVYGLISLPLHKNLTFGQAWLALAVFVLFMLLCSIAKERTVRWWRSGRQASVSAS